VDMYGHRNISIRSSVEFIDKHGGKSPILKGKATQEGTHRKITDQKGVEHADADRSFCGTKLGGKTHNPIIADAPREERGEG